MKRPSDPRSSASRSAVRASAAAGSRCSAGSSRTRMGNSARRARATATRWRCPPESRDPPGPTSVARPSGRPASQSPSPTRASTATELVVVGAAPADPQVLGQRGAEEMWALLDQPDDPPAPRRRRGAPAARRRASPRRRRAAGSAPARRPGSTCRRRCGPTSATRRPGLQVEVDAAQARAGRCRGSRPRPTRSVERVRPPVGQRSRRLGLLHRGGGVHGGEHAAGGHPRTLQRLGRRRQR